LNIINKESKIIKISATWQAFRY